MLSSSDPVISVERTADGEIRLHTLSEQGLTEIGTYADAVEAWAAIDALDAPELLELPVAA